MNPDDYSGKGHETREAIQKAKRDKGTERGYTHYKNLRDEQLTDAFHYTLFQILQFHYGLMDFTF